MPPQAKSVLTHLNQTTGRVNGTGSSAEQAWLSPAMVYRRCLEYPVESVLLSSEHAPCAGG